MNQKEIQLTSDIMFRVRTVYYMRLLLRPVPVKSAVLVLSVVSMSFLVSIPNVIGNMSHLPGAFDAANYIAVAFMHTSPIVEAVIVLSLAAGCWLAYDIARNIKYLKYIRPPAPNSL